MTYLYISLVPWWNQLGKKTCWMYQFHLSLRLALLLPLRAAAWLRHRQRRRKRLERRRRAAQQQGHAGGEESHLERQENLGGFHHGLGCL